MKKLAFIRRRHERHWVGDGFPVRGIFSYDRDAAILSPFLLLDYAGPENFPPAEKRRGVGPHPHRGFETVTITYSGEVAHRDSSGGGGVIGPGDVQWMTAASGIVHEEFHGTEYAKRGGPFEMIQLWVNLAAKDKKAPPGYQNIADAQIPRVELAQGAGTVRVIAGSYKGLPGPARTFSPMNVWDMGLKGGGRTEFRVPSGWTAALFVLKGKIRFASGETAGAVELAVLQREEEEFAIEAMEDSAVLVLNGEPINEPVVGHGPFVMNTQVEIAEAMADYRAGRMGHLVSPG
ncbi:MAG: pirin family protein [Beijerinckiaceae bacterium]|nr:pirin family protein [Beijerinckiaceae bacterium]